jgi:exonuclease VII small subunit
MALLDYDLKPTVGGIAIGLGVAVVAPIIVPILASIVKPLTKAVIKEGLILYKTGKETVTEAQEAVEDLVAEAKSEIVTATRVAAKKKKKNVSPGTPSPLAKAIMDEGRALYDKGRGVITEAKEAVEQLVEEAKSEIAASAAAKES